MVNALHKMLYGQFKQIFNKFAIATIFQVTHVGKDEPPYLIDPSPSRVIEVDVLNLNFNQSQAILCKIDKSTLLESNFQIHFQNVFYLAYRNPFFQFKQLLDNQHDRIIKGSQ